MFRVVSLLILSGAFVLAQTVSGTLTGTVKDPKQSAVPGAKVLARNSANGAQASAQTDELGFYRLANLTPGEYQVEFSATGFRTAKIAAGYLGPAEVLRLDALLELGALHETVTVETRAIQVNTDDPQLGRAVREIPRLPLLSTASGRTGIALVFLLPGITPSISTSQQGDASVSGQRFYSNNVQFDGADANQQVAGWMAASAGWISPNAVSEIRLITGPMKAEYGRNSGSVMSIIPKSGSNAWHGGATEVLRNTRLNAAPFFQQAIAGGTPSTLPDGSARKPKYIASDFDANLGGPVIRDKAFFFVSYLGFRRRQGTRSSAVVPSDSQRAAIEAQGVKEAKALLALVPRATYGNTLLSAPVDSLRRDQGLARLDYAFSPGNRMGVTYFIEDSDGAWPFTSSPVPGFGGLNASRTQQVILRHTQVFSPRLFQEFRASFLRVATDNLQPINRTKLASLGLGGIVPDNPNSEGPPWVSLSGFSSFGNTYNGPQAYKTDQFQLLDNVSWTAGRHLAKFGGELRTFAMNTTFDNSPNGSITIDGSGTLANPRLVPRVISGLTAALNDFANGFAASFSQTSSARVAHRSRSVNAFVQDDWRITSALSLNLGLRWEYNSPYVDVRDRVVTFRPGLRSAVFADAPAGLVFAGDAGIPRSTIGEDLNNFSPRFGFAWDLLKNGRLAVRGGYGLFYDTPFQEVLMGASLYSPPFSIRPGTLYTDYANPWQASRVNPIPQPFPYHPPKPGERVDFTRFAPVAFIFLDPSFRTPYGQQWSLQVQWQPRQSWLLEAGYLGSNGVKLSNELQYNYALAGPGATVGNTPQRRILNVGNAENAKFGGAVFGSVTLHTGNANSNYHSFQFMANRRLARGLEMTHSYTWSHNIDNASGRRVSSRYDPRQDRGNSDTDKRHRYVGSFIYLLPFQGRLCGGWGLSGFVGLSSGLWTSVSESQDRCLCGTGNQRADSLGRAIQYLDPRSITAVPGASNSWFDGTGAATATGEPNPYFRRVGSGPSYALGAGRYGNAGRNTILGPGTNNWNLAGFKRTRIRERHEVEFRAELFNAFNHTQFNLPNTSIDSPNFGRITGTANPRIVQLGLRYLF